jgi:uncharacterized ubiquitin-like protein YukD
MTLEAKYCDFSSRYMSKYKLVLSVYQYIGQYVDILLNFVDIERKQT